LEKEEHVCIGVTSD